MAVCVKSHVQANQMDKQQFNAAGQTKPIGYMDLA